jgi:hypothetical protein
LNADGVFLTYASTTSSPTPDAARRATSSAAGESLTDAGELAALADIENATATTATQTNNRVFFIKLFPRACARPTGITSTDPGLNVKNSGTGAFVIEMRPEFCFNRRWNASDYEIHWHY